MFEKEFHELESIQFGMYSTEEIQKMSVCEVNSVKLSGPNSVYDKRMGILELNETCPTCQKSSKFCVGHFGHINLNVSVLHPLYYRLILNILKCTCYKCSRLLLTSEKLQLDGVLKGTKAVRFQSVVKKMDKIDVCSYCGTFQPKYIFSTSEKQIYMNFKTEQEVARVPMFENEIYKIFSNVCQEDINLLGLDIQHFHPKNLILNSLLVIPPVSRPYVLADSVTCDDDITLQYIEIIKSNNHIVNNKTSELKRTKYIQMLKFRIRCLFDNSGEKQKVSNGRSMKGIKKRLTGKEGIIRNNLMGKRVDKSARSVIGPDPTLNIDQIGVPQQIAKILSYPIYVNDCNIDKIYEMIDKGIVNYIIKKQNQIRINVKYATTRLGTKILFGDMIYRKREGYFLVTKEDDKFLIEDSDVLLRNGEPLLRTSYNTKKTLKLEVGDIIERQLLDNDILLLNRQPTLHRGSCIAMKVKILPGKTIRLNLAITSTFNADFDGDEMNLFLPNNVETEAELRMLSSVDNFIINAQSSSSNIVLVQDTILGIYKMTLSKNASITRLQAFNILHNLNDETIISYFLQLEKIYMKRKDIQFKSYERLLLSCLFPSNFFYESNNEIDPNEPILRIEKGIFLTGAFRKKDLNKIISLLHLEYNVEVAKYFINNIQFMAIHYLLTCSFTIGIKDCVLKKNNIEHTIGKALMKAKSIEESLKNEKLKEIYTMYSLGSARDTGLSIAKNSLDPENNFISTVLSGAKGDFFNIAQITGLLGQQSVTGGRVKYTLSNNQRSLPHYPIEEKDWNDDDRYESKGFIKGCFAKGLSPKEFFLHSLTGREGITDTAMKTATSGYIQRRMIKFSEDVHVSNDGTVRNLNNNIIDFAYGNNFLNSSNTIIKHGKVLPLDIERLAMRVNYDFENEKK